MTSHDLLTGRTIIVTGAATGIGQAFALGCAAQGAHVVVADMNPAEETMQAIAAAGAQATYVQVDVSDEASTRAMAQAALSATGRIDGLINNAAYFREVKLTPFEDISNERWQRIFDVNVKGVWQCCKAVLPAMRERQSGAIVNIASVAAFDGQIGQASYSASKGGVVGMTLPIARDLAAVGVRVNTVAPGLIDTPIYGKGDASEAFKANLQKGVLVPQRLGSSEELASMVLECITNSYMNAETIRVDGGIRMPPK